MARLPHSSPGWYPEPDIVAGAGRTLRYWDGTGWTDRRRPRPVLADLDLSGVDGTGRPLAIEGPVRALELPAPAAEIAAGREAPAGRTGSRDQPVDDDAPPADRPSAPGGGWDGPTGPPPATGGGGGDNGSGERDAGDSGTRAPAATWWRRKWWLLCAVAVIGAMAVGLAGQAMRPKSVERRVLTDAAFIRAANAECTTTLPGLRPPDGGPLGSAVNATQAADQIERAATGMDALVGRLAALPAADADRPHIAGWLADWHRYAATGHDYAAFLRQHGANQKNPPAILDTAARLGRSVDGFARANGLSRCLLAFVYTASPSDF